ncbi:tumor necrosis factor-inducible gene 6 protein-like isoform X2 [Oncorhynchus keta]|uniref:tumor necrosis factor-inducible gene 6 protein-like isoform X2 n=1 Tax=Oncorhynchus keta TaxID=8018 RepID=UPI0015FC2891|nr:tumor necrosis factor-inducible gene 6 protein-like isoform X2 [Oncorhynchus keta]
MSSEHSANGSSWPEDIIAQRTALICTRRRMRVFAVIWAIGFFLKEAQAWGFRNGIFHNSIWLGLHVCAAGWYDKGRVGYPIVKAGANCGFGRVGIINYGYRLNKSERWDVYCYNPNSKECGGTLTDQQRIIQSPGYPEEYQDEQICYWHIRVRYGQRIRLHFLEFDVEEDTACLSDFLEIYDSYDDITGFAGRYCGYYLPDDLISTGNVMTLKFLSDASVVAGGFQMEYIAVNSSLLHFQNDTSCCFT